MSRADGGPAFPVDPFAASMPGNVDQAKRLAEGMSLRDYFAESAPITLKDALIANGFEGTSIVWLSKEKRMEIFALLAQLRLEYADAMIAERAK